MKKYFLSICSLLCLMTGMANAQFKDILDFNITNGQSPLAGLTLSGNKLYGMTSTGGAHGDGVVFSIDTDGTHYKDLLDFNLTNGKYPQDPLTVSGNKLYGMTFFGGANNDGIIFSMDTDGTHYKDLLDFNLTNGKNPYAGVTLSGHTLFGATEFGGANNDGLIFSLDTNGGKYKDLLDFNVTNGQDPQCSLALSGDILYGVTVDGGAHNDGLVFSIDTNGTHYKDLFNFNGTNGNGPVGALMLSGNTLYGTTYQGGANNDGLIFSLDTNGSNYKDLLDFNNTNGTTPFGPLTVFGNTIYGVTGAGGANYDGLIFSLDINGSNFKDMLDFNLTNGQYPVGPLALFKSKLFGMAAGGGGHNYGLAFSMFVPLSVSPGSIGISCNGNANGEASAYALGGASPYTYKWAPGGSTTDTITGLSAGNYTVTVTDSSHLTLTANVVITQPAVLGITLNSHTDPLCNGNTGSATANIATGGTSPYTYSWTPNGGSNLTASNLSIGTYTITVKDNNGCTASANLTITQPPALIAAIGLETNVLCNGNTTGSATVTTSGGIPPYTYSWSPWGGSNAMATGLTAGVYTVTITDINNCSITAPAIITQPSAMVITKDSTSVNSTKACNGKASVNVSGGTAPYTYNWSPGGGTNDTIRGKCTDRYCCTIIDNNGCKDSICVTISNITGIDNISNNSDQVTVYPNPNNGQFTLQSSFDGESLVEIYNVLGEKVFIKNLNSNKGSNSINISQQPNGVYLYRVITENGNLLGEGKIILDK